MDGLRLTAQKRIDDFDVVQRRLTRQWHALVKRLTEELPQKYTALLKSQSTIVLERLTRTFSNANSKLEKRWEMTKAHAAKMSDRSMQRLQKRWLELQPRLDNFVQTSFAISTATSTLQLTVQVTPILLSALTILATAPMLNALLPEFLFNSTVLFFIMMAISACAGYSKFKELETRAKLDGQIELHEKATKKNHKQINRLKKRLKECERLLGAPGADKNPLLMPEKKSEVVDQNLQSNHIKVATPTSVDNDYRQASRHKR